MLVSMWDAQRAGGLPAAERAILHAILGELGARSATAQGLGAPITDLAKLEANGGQRLYLAAQRQSSTSLVVFGGLKVGEKRLFVWPPGERQQREVLATCVLDFYVHESVQCMGIGHQVPGQCLACVEAEAVPRLLLLHTVLVATGARKPDPAAAGLLLQLFDAFLEAEELQPGALAYDLPSPKLLAFMTKHYGLHSPISFTNSFAVFPPFIETAAAGSAGAAAGGARRPPASSCWVRRCLLLPVGCPLQCKRPLAYSTMKMQSLLRVGCRRVWRRGR